MSDIIRWLRARQEVEQRNVRTVSGASEAAELYGRAADEITRLRARVVELEAREDMRASVAKECIESGGQYHETMFRRRPICKKPR